MPKKYSEGVKSFSAGLAQVKIFFPEGKETCQYCDFCYSEDSLERFRCRLMPTRRIIPNPFLERAAFCPIKEIIKEEN